MAFFCMSLCVFISLTKTLSLNLVPTLIQFGISSGSLAKLYLQRLYYQIRSHSGFPERHELNGSGTPLNPLQVFIQQKGRYGFTKDMNTNGHKSPKLETSQRSIHSSMGKQMVTQSHNRILHNKEKGQPNTMYIPQVDLSNAE